MTSPSGPASGWYPDPQGPPGQERWWDSTAGHWGEFIRARPEPTTGQRVDPWKLTAAAGCVGMLLSPFSPWATALGGIVSRSGFDLVALDAWVMLALAAGCALIVYRWNTDGTPRDLSLLLTAGAVFGLAIFHYVDIVENHEGLAVGWGLYLGVLGSGAVVAVAGLGLLKQR